MRTDEEYQKLAQEKNKKVDVIGKYEGYYKKIKVRCKRCNREWETSTSAVLKGCGCKKCQMEDMWKSHRTTDEQFKAEVAKNNSKITVIGTYFNRSTKIRVKCNFCGKEWDMLPQSALDGSGCKECTIAGYALSHEDFLERSKNSLKNFEVIEKYVNNATPIKVKCKRCGKERYINPSSIFYNNATVRCDDCDKNPLAKSHEDFVNEISILSPYVTVLNEYSNTLSIMNCKCNLCAYEWSTKAKNLLAGKGCPNCNKSKGERRIQSFLHQKEIKYFSEYKFPDCKDIYPLPFDFYLPDLNVAIEFDGKQHTTKIEIFGGQEALDITRKHDEMKNEYCKNNGIRLIRISYKDINNIEQILNKELFS